MKSRRVPGFMIVAVLVLLVSSCRSRAQGPAPPEGVASPSPTGQPPATSPGPSPTQPEVTSAPSTTATPTISPASGAVQGTLEVGKTYTVGISGRNANIQLSVTGFQLVSAIGGQEAPAGMQYVLLSTSWKNLVTPKTVQRPKSGGRTGIVGGGNQEMETVIVETPYLVKTLAENLYLLIDGKMVAEVSDATEQIDDHLPLTGLLIAHYNDEIKGTVAFAVPAGPKHLALQFYDFEHGHITLSLYGTVPAVKNSSLAGPSRNQFFDAAVYGVEFSKKIDQTDAPAGMQYVSVDFGASSVAVGAATQLDFGQYAYLIQDDVYQWRPLTDVAGMPALFHGLVRFIPGFVRHGIIVFAVPAEPARWELLLSASQMDPLSFVLTPNVAARTQPSPVRTIDDGNTAQILINSTTFAEQLAGQTSQEGFRYLILDLTVVNKESRQGLIIDPQQFAPTDGQSVFARSSATEQLAHALTGERVVPAGRRLRFELAFEVPKTAPAVRLKYQGFTKIEEVPLP